MKRKVLAPDVLSKISWRRRYYDSRNNYYYNAHFFNNLTLFILLSGITLFLALWIHELAALSISVTAYCLFAWVRTKKLAHGIHIRRLHKNKGRELDEFEFHYEISNESGFDLPAFTFRQPFTGVQEGSFEVHSNRSIPPQTKTRLSVKVPLNAGMGVKKIGDFLLEISDELGLFPFRVSFEGTKDIEVAPLIIETPQLKKSISPDSTEFGFYDIQKRGESNLFIGTREYRHGDPVKNINWKLSRKTNKLIVNEYEKNTNTYVTLLLDLELGSQIGLGAVSTWEAAKDLALSIAANETKLRNYVQVLAQDLYVPFGTGHTQMLTIERHFTYHELSSSGLDHLEHLQNLPSQSQIYFFCPLLATRHITETIKILKRMRLLNHRVTVFALDPYNEMRKTVSGEAFAPLTSIGLQARREFEAITKDLKSSGIDFVKIDIDERHDLHSMLVSRAQHLLEDKR